MDQVVSPTYVPHLVDAALDLLIDGERGIWHLVNGGAVSWFELARLAAQAAELEPRVVATLTDLPARRPRYSALASERGRIMPTLEEGLAAYSGVTYAAVSPPSTRNVAPLT
jgi:dTDP-4-dehydrorhamnose reductase